jgi:hypothetical protein
MKSHNCHQPLVTRFLPGESDDILKEVEDHGGQNVVNRVFIVRHLILALHLKVH